MPEKIKQTTDNDQQLLNVLHGLLCSLW